MLDRNKIYGHEIVLQPVELVDTVNIPGKTWTKYVYLWSYNGDKEIELATFSSKVVIGRLYNGVMQPSNFEQDVFKVLSEAPAEEFPCNLLANVDDIGPKVTKSFQSKSSGYSAKSAPAKSDKFSEYSLRQTALNDAVKLVAALVEKTSFNTKGDMLLGKAKVDIYELIRQYYTSFIGTLTSGEFGDTE